MNSDLQQLSNREILELEAEEVRKYFLKSENYCGLSLPRYIDFTNLLADIDKLLQKSKITDFVEKGKLREDHNNYNIIHNKDGCYAWRPFQLIHPALYVDLVHKITEQDNWKQLQNRFKKFRSNKKIQCLSIPVLSLSKQMDRAEQVSKWWQRIEQQSIVLSMRYSYLFVTDITDCYGAIYTHSIAWALHGIKEAKENPNDESFLGNIIDKCIRSMKYGQTNGIPQGSVLMDFIAEIVLGYADLELSEKIKKEKITNYQILRYRDDYRIFVCNPQDGHKIIRILTEVLMDLGLKLNPEKTKNSHEVILLSIKKDKIEWNQRLHFRKNLQKNLLMIYDFAHLYPNTGSLDTALRKFFKRLKRISRKNKFIKPIVMISIVTDIAVHNPRTYSISMAILSKLLELLPISEQLKSQEHIIYRFQSIPNTAYLQIWLQRITYPIVKEAQKEGVITSETIQKIKAMYQTPLCNLVADAEKTLNTLWRCVWLKQNSKLEKMFQTNSIINYEKLNKLPKVMKAKEFELFNSYGQ